MARNASGTHSLPSGNPVVTGTSISSTVHNNTLADISTEITDSLNRSGKGAMLAPLELTDGAVGTPSLSFDSDTDTGLYRVGANNPAISAGGTKAQEWTATTTTIPVAAAATAGVTVTQSASNTAGTTTTGNGTGAGVVATGGATGNGGTFSGGATSGAGVAATGTGASTGVTGTGGATNGVGVAGAGTGSGTGVTGTGGATGKGVAGTGGGTAVGGSFANGTASIAATPQNAAELTNGNLSMAGVANPNSTVSFTNTLTPKGLVKAWAKVTTDGVGGVSASDGLNVASVSLPGGNAVRVTFAGAMGNANYAALATMVGSTGWFVSAGSPTTAQCDFFVYNTAGASLVDPATNAFTFTAMVIGAQ